MRSEAVNRFRDTDVLDAPASRLHNGIPNRADSGGARLAAPSVLGLFGLFAATVVYGSTLAGWWGGTASPILVFPFVTMLGGLAQLIACVWAHRDRDELAAAVHGVWSAFWLAFGVYELLVTVGKLPQPVTGRANAVDFGMWFVPLAAITAALALAAVGRSIVLAGILTVLAGAAVLAAVGFAGNQPWSVRTSGWLFVLAAALAWYLASALLIENERGRAVLPTGRRRGRP
jgi:hypothetical protein